MDMADRLVQDGYKELGYEFVNIDVSKLSTLCRRCPVTCDDVIRTAGTQRREMPAGGCSQILSGSLME